ncbi:hypothetical protein ABBQ32_010789 [Trebouxia sp. C0010 RCD-2024]
MQGLADDATACCDTVLNGGRHAFDAEMYWLHSVLKDDSIKNIISSKFSSQLQKGFPLILQLHLSTAPCDQCCRMIISQHEALEDRFGYKVHVAISAVMDFSDNQCLGLAELSKSLDWLHFEPVWQSINEQLLA